MKKKVARAPEDRMRTALAEARLAAFEMRNHDALQAFDDPSRGDDLPAFKVRLRATEHAWWIADMIDHGRAAFAPKKKPTDAASVLLALFFARSSPLTDHVEKRWAESGAKTRDTVALAKRLMVERESARRPAGKALPLDGEAFVKLAASVVRWPKPGNLFSARDQEKRRSATSS